MFTLQSRSTVLQKIAHVCVDSSHNLTVVYMKLANLDVAIFQIDNNIIQCF